MLKYCIPEGNELTKDDYVIVCGDFGYWLPSAKQDYELDWLGKKPWTTLFVDGNHECYSLDLPNILNTEVADFKRCHYNKALLDYPIEEWNGGKIHKINDSVFHLMRGQVFELCGKTIFTFGGARSHDISDGILDPFSFEDRKDFQAERKEWYDRNLMFRIKNISWWEEELSSREERIEAENNLAKHNWNVDYIVTHCASNEIQALCGYSGRDYTTDFLQMVKERAAYRKWFFGHYHDNRNVTANDLMIYEQIIRIA